MISPEQKIILIIISYLIGAISSSIIICRIKKVDIRTIGSGNAGATNTVRALGKKFGAIVLFLDMLKGSLPTMIAKILSPESLILPIACAFATVLGHVFPIYFSFKGGKGAATFIGTIIVIFPIGALICFLVWISVLILSGYLDVHSIVTKHPCECPTREASFISIVSITSEIHLPCSSIDSKAGPSE